MKKTNLATLLVAFIIIFLSNCIKDNNNTTGELLGTIDLTSTELSYLPYHIADHVSFSDASGDTITLTINEYNSYYITLYKDGRTDIPTDYYEVETKQIKLELLNKAFVILQLSAPLPPYVSVQHQGKSLLKAVVMIHTDSTNSQAIYNEFQAYLDSNDFHYNQFGESIPFHQSIELNGKIFDSVHELKEKLYNQNNDYPLKVYYSNTKGIVGIEMDKGSLWTLIP